MVAKGKTPSKDSPSDDNDRSIVKTLLKGLDLLDVVAQANRPMTVSEIAGTFDMDIGTVHRFLNTFVKKRYLGQDNHTKQYFLGAKVLQLSRMFYEQHRIYDMAREQLVALSSLCEETVQLSVFSAIPCAIVVDEIQGMQSTSISIAIGTQLPLHCSAAGKAMLAVHEMSLRERILSKIELAALTPNSITDRAALLKEYDLIAKRGWAEDNAEFSEGVHAIAAPIYNLNAEPVAAIAVITPSFRYDKKKMHGLSEDLCRLAAEISRKMGHEQNAR